MNLRLYFREKLASLTESADQEKYTDGVSESTI